MKRVQKVVVYVTHGDRMLVFSHRDFPEVGVQVPAGTLEAGEDKAEAAIREAEEETGLSLKGPAQYLGSHDFDARIFRPEIHERHFFRVEASAADAEKEPWLHFETKPSGGDMKEIAYQLYWTDIATADLFAEQGAFLDKIKGAAFNAGGIPPRRP